MAVRMHLVVVQAHAPPLEIGLAHDETTIGCAADSMVRIDDPQVQAQHALIKRTGLVYTLIRKASPLHLNGKRVRQEVLRPGDLITIGRAAMMIRAGAPSADEEENHSDKGEAASETLRRLVQLGRGVAAQQSPEVLSRRLLQDLLELTGADRGRLLLFEGTRHDVAFDEGISPAAFAEHEQQVSRTVISRILDEKRPLLWSNARDDEHLGQAPSVMQAQIRALMCAPISDGEKILGALYVSSAGATTRFTESSLDLLSLFASQAALLVQQTRQQRELQSQVAVATEALSQWKKSPIIGSSPAMRALLAQVDKVAGVSIPVLLLGETGTGKEVFAHELHRHSPRVAQPFVAVHCGAIPENLLESELFGHVKGAFTGANQDRPGMIRAAHKGTLFLDEIGEMPLHQQAKLLRVLQDSKVVPVGGESSVSVDFRLVCATNVDLQERIKSGTFRSDLYFRIAGITLNLPALRERSDDAVVLAEHFLEKFRSHLQRPRVRFSGASLTAIRSHTWPGNVRELDSSIQRAILLCEDEVIEPVNLGLPDQWTIEEEDKPLNQVRDEFLKQYVRAAVARHSGNRLAAARALMVSPRTIFKYLEEI